METERKKKKGRREEKKLPFGIELGTFDTPGQSFTTGPRGTHKQFGRNFISKTFEPYSLFFNSP